MARGNWRNWDEMFCPKCAARYFKKDLKSAKGKYFCQCGEELKEDDSLPYIKDDDDRQW